MITNECVFVIGAGASKPYGFPLGSELKNNVLNYLKRPDGLLPTIFNKNLIDAFYTALLGSGAPSVDAFLEKRSEFVEIGKFVMSRTLINLEIVNRLFDGGDRETEYSPHDYRIKGDWLIYLNSFMNAEFDNFKNNKVQFITYNYDRILETYLFETLKNSFGKSDEEVASVVNSIKIIHLHGKLGYLPWQNADKTKKRAFIPASGNKEQEVRRIIEIGASEIKIVHQANPDSKEFVEAREILKKSNVIIFLGFGFAPKNIERLQLIPGNKQILATGIGQTKMDINLIKKKYFNNSANCYIDENFDCLDLLRNLGQGLFN